MEPGGEQEGGPTEGAVRVKCFADMEANGQPVKDLVEDSKEGLADEGLDPDLLTQMS